MSELTQLVPCGLVAAFRFIAEGKERLVAAGLGTSARDSEHLISTHVRSLAFARRLRERAVVADVAAEHGQRNEDLGRVGDRDLAPRPELLRRLENVFGPQLAEGEQI